MYATCITKKNSQINIHIIYIKRNYARDSKAQLIKLKIEINPTRSPTLMENFFENFFTNL